MIRALSRLNSVRNACLGSEYFRPRESPDFSANDARTSRSAASISSRVFQSEGRRAAPESEEFFVTIDSSSYFSILVFETSNLICPRKLAPKNPPKGGFAAADKLRPNV